MKKLQQFKALVFVAVLLAGASLVGQTIRFRLPQVAGDPSTVANGDLWYNTSSNAFRARINGSTVSMGAGLTSPVAAADGGTGQTTPTADNVLVGDGSAWNKKALPTCSNGTNDKLLYDTSTDAFSCGTDQAGSGGGGLTLVEQHAASSSSSISFTSCFTSTYDDYVIRFTSLVLSANARLNAFVSTNGGSSYDTGANYGSHILRYQGGSSAIEGASSGESEWHLDAGTGDLKTGSLWGINGNFTFSDPLNASIYKTFYGEMTYQSNFGAGLARTISTHVYRSNTAVNAVQFSPSGGNFTSGQFRCYGVEK